MTVKPEQSVYTLVVGLGKTGLSVVRYLRALGEAVIIVDSRDIPPCLGILKDEYSDVECYTGSFDASLFVAAHRIIVSPGVALAEPALVEASNKNIEIIGDIDLFAQAVTAPVIGITGSNGKSTVTTLLALMATESNLKSVASGNIGTPALDSLDEDVDMYVLELSSFQLETLKHLPMKAATVLNISADHLDRYENLTAYALSKQVIYENAETVVLNKDDVLANKYAGKHTGTSQNRIRFTLNKPEANEFGLCMTKDDVLNLCFGEQELLPVDQLKIKGAHNIQNALAALALGYAAGLSLENMLQTLRTFKGLRHRTQLVAEINGINWVNDSKATNVGATIAAITGLAGKHILIAGGVAKDADFSVLKDVVEKHCCAVVLVGKDASQIEDVLQDCMQIETVLDMQSAVQAAFRLAEELLQQGDNVLLAPACASFDMFDSFEHRGDVFIAEVERLITDSGGFDDQSEVLS